MTKVINFIGGPGRGKSTTAFLCAGYFKLHTDLKTELLIEPVKWLTYLKDFNTLSNQEYITSRMAFEIATVKDQVQLLITDYSLLNGVGYTQDKYLQEYCLHNYSKQDNINFLIPRKAVYQQVGRAQKIEEAVEIDHRILNFVELNKIPYHDFSQQTLEDAIHSVIAIIKKVVYR